MGTITPILPKGATIAMPDRFKCPVCGKEPTCRGFSNHLTSCLQKHNMTSEEYENVHQATLYSPAHQFAVKWFQLAKFDIYHFGLMEYAHRTWCHIDAGNPKPWYYDRWRRPETCPLLRFEDGQPNLRKSFWHFRKHLSGDLTLGIWPAMNNRFTMIDLDDADVEYRDELVERLIDLHLFFYVIFSGKKGYQVWIFWDKDLPHEQLLQLQAFLCEDIPHDDRVWPYKQSLIKLPLGLHRGTHHLACFVDLNGEPVGLDEQLSYFLDIKDNPVPKAFFWWRERLVFPVTNPGGHRSCMKLGVRAPARADSDGHPVSSRDVKALNCCLEEGTKLEEGRHFTLFVLALHLKENKNASLGEAELALEAWSSHVSSKYGLKERLRDAHATVKSVYEKDMVFSGICMSPLTEEERTVIEGVCDVYISVYGLVGSGTRKEDGTKRKNSAQKVALVMAAIAKGHGGSFSVGHRRLAELTGLSRQTVGQALRVLVEDPVRELPPDREDYDPVFWNFDKRPRRDGGMFVCERRGSFPTYRKSVYQLKDEVVESLGWNREGHGKEVRA